MSAKLTGIPAAASEYGSDAVPHLHDGETRDSPDGSSAISLLGLLSTLLRHARLLLALPFGFAAAIVAVTMVLPHSYSATTLFTAVGGSSSASLSRVAGLASQLGLSMPTGGSQQSPEFYAAFLASDQILSKIVTQRYAIPGGRDSVRGDLTELFRRPTILEYLHIIHPSRAARIEQTVEQLLDRAITFETDDNTGLVTVTVTTRWPSMSYAIAAGLLHSADEFSQESQRQVAEAEARFARERMDTAGVELRRSEVAMQSFLIQNRQYQTDPQLSFEYDRLNRNLTTRQGVYATVVQDYEQSRISAARDTPTILSVQDPIVPPIPDPRRLAVKALAGVVLGGLLALLIVFWREFMAAQMVRGRTDAEEFLRLWRTKTSPIRRTAHRVTRFRK